MGLLEEINLYDPAAERQREEELGYLGPIQMWDIDLSYDATPETWEEAERQDDAGVTLWKFSGTVKYPTKFRRNGIRWIPAAWEERHTGVHYTVEEHGWGCDHDCNIEHGWIEFVNPGESGLEDDDKPEAPAHKHELRDLFFTSNFVLREEN